MCREYRRVKGWRGAWRANPGGFFLTIVNVICKPIAISGASHTDRECGHLYISYPQHADPGRKQYPKLVIPVSHGGKADLANLTVGIFPSLGWLDGYFSPNVDSGVLTPMFEKNNQSPALQAGFFELPNSSGEIQRYHST